MSPKWFRSLKTVFRVNLRDSTQADTSSLVNRMSRDSRLKHSNNVITGSRGKRPHGEWWEGMSKNDWHYCFKMNQSHDFVDSDSWSTKSCDCIYVWSRFLMRKLGQQNCLHVTGSFIMWLHNHMTSCLYYHNHVMLEHLQEYFQIFQIFLWVSIKWSC